jgi:hypothetical protein
MESDLSMAKKPKPRMRLVGYAESGKPIVRMTTTPEHLIVEDESGRPLARTRSKPEHLVVEDDEQIASPNLEDYLSLSTTGLETLATEGITPEQYEEREPDHGLAMPIWVREVWQGGRKVRDGGLEWVLRDNLSPTDRRTISDQNNAVMAWVHDWESTDDISNYDGFVIYGLDGTEYVLEGYKPILSRYARTGEIHFEDFYQYI